MHSVTVSLCPKNSWADQPQGVNPLLWRYHSKRHAKEGPLKKKLFGHFCLEYQLVMQLPLSDYDMGQRHRKRKRGGCVIYCHFYVCYCYYVKKIMLSRRNSLPNNFNERLWVQPLCVRSTPITPFPKQRTGLVM